MCCEEARSDEGEETDNRLACGVEVDVMCERGEEGRGEERVLGETRREVRMQG